MPFTEEFLARIDFAAERLNFQQENLVNIVENLAVPLLRARQNVARTIQAGVKPEDESLYVDKFERLNRELIILFGFVKNEKDNE